MIITSRKNQLITETRELVGERKTRTERGEFVIEGQKLVSEAISSGLKLTRAFVTKSFTEKNQRLCGDIEEKCDVIIISDDVADAISDTKTPQGVFVIAKILDKITNSDTILTYKKIIVLDGLQDAGNVGTIVRTAEAMGIEAIILSGDTADIYSPKVVRGAMGSLFRLPCMIENLENVLPKLSADGFDVYAAMLDEKALRLGSFRFGEKTAVVIGNEGKGISEKVAACCGKKVYIPIKNAESLNAAAAASILCWELGKQRL